MSDAWAVHSLQPICLTHTHQETIVTTVTLALLHLFHDIQVHTNPFSVATHYHWVTFVIHGTETVKQLTEHNILCFAPPQHEEILLWRLGFGKGVGGGEDTSQQ